MRILRIINRFNLGGPTFNAALLSRYLPEEYETLLVGGEKDYSEDDSLHILDKLELSPIIIPEMKREVSPINDRIAYKKICALIEEFKPDIVHTHASKAGALGRLAAFKMNVPHTVHTFHGHVFHSYFGSVTTEIYKRVERYLAARSSAIIAISEEQRRELVEDFKVVPAEKAKVIQLGFDLDKFQEDFQSKREEFRTFYQLEDGKVAIGIVGRLVPIKNHLMFLRSIKHLIEENKHSFRAFIIGDGEMRPALENYCREVGIRFNDPEIDEDDHVTFTSWIKDIDVANAGLDIAALTSKNEGTPVSLIEAQAANRPIISTEVGGIRDIVDAGNTAFLVRPDDQEGFNRYLSELCASSELRSKMGQNGWEFVKERFHYSRLVRDMDTLYKSL
jgi:glycosyltransferase involved in cell wall biosynthesis